MGASRWAFSHVSKQEGVCMGSAVITALRPALRTIVAVRRHGRQCISLYFVQGLARDVRPVGCSRHLR